MNNAVQVALGTRTYRVRAGWKVFTILCCLLLIAAGLASLWFLVLNEKLPFGRAIFLIVVFGAFVVLGAYGLLSVIKSRVVLSGDAIESSGVWITRTLRKEDILGWSTLPQKNAPPTIVLVPKSASVRKVRLNAMLNLDAEFYRWLDQFEDLDVREEAASMEAILSAEELGTTAEQRIGELAKAKRISQVLNVCSFAFLFWTIFYPKPYEVLIAILCALPWSALLLIVQSPGLYRLDERKNDAHPNLAMPFIMPGFALLLRVVFDLELVTWSRPATFACVVALLMTIAASLADKQLRQRKVALISILVCSVAYGFGATLQANALLDRAPTEIYSSNVIRKHVSHGKHTSYKLEVAPWGPKSTESEVTVSKTFYEEVVPGDSVCMQLHSGALKIQWYTVHPCQ